MHNMIDPQQAAQDPQAQDAQDPQAQELETHDVIDAVVVELGVVQADIQNQVDAAGVTDQVDLSGLDGVAQALEGVCETLAAVDEAEDQGVSDMAQILMDAFNPVDPFGSPN